MDKNMQKAAVREIFRTAAFLMEDCPELPVISRVFGKTYFFRLKKALRPG